MTNSYCTQQEFQAFLKPLPSPPLLLRLATARCRKVLQSLVQRTARGLHPIPASTSTKPSVAQDGSGYGQEERSWRLVYCQRPGVLGQAALGQVHSVLSADWAYTMQASVCSNSSSTLR